MSSVCYSCSYSGQWSSFCNGCNGTGRIPPNVLPCFCCKNTGMWHNGHCRGCEGKGYVPPNVQQCFACTNSGQWHNGHCRGCDGAGYIPLNMSPCFACLNSGQWHNGHCKGCEGKGYISPTVIPCYACKNSGQWHNGHCRGCEGRGYISSTVQQCFACTNSGQWHNGHCRGCDGAGYIPLNTSPCSVCSNTGNWHNGHCAGCSGKGYIYGVALSPPDLPNIPVPPQSSQTITGLSPGSTIALTPNSHEFGVVKTLFERGQLTNTPFRIDINVVSIERIHNPALFHGYKSSVYECALFHGTSEGACYAIAKTGYRLGTSECLMLGKGIYFAPNPNKSRHYSCQARKMLLSRVNLEGSQYSMNSIYQEYCVYSIKQAIPLYIITFR